MAWSENPEFDPETAKFPAWVSADHARLEAQIVGDLQKICVSFLIVPGQRIYRLSFFRDIIPPRKGGLELHAGRASIWNGGSCLQTVEGL